MKGLRIYYESEGNGLPLCLIHGAASTHSIWKNQIKVFSAGYRVIAPDLPGHGRSGPFDDSSRISIRQYAGHVREFLETLGVEEAVMVGHSMGGAVCIQLVLDSPWVVRGLGLINTGAKLRVSPHLLSALREDFRGTMEKGWESMFGEKGKRILHCLEGLKEEMVGIDPVVGVADFEACDEFDCRERLGEIEKPTLIIGGTEDILTPPWYQDYLHKRIKNSVLVIMGGVGHLSMVEDPEEFNGALLSFLQHSVR